jgi:uncharacterized protein (TIGR00297 family)
MFPLSLLFNFPIFFIILKKHYLTFPAGIGVAAILGISLFVIQPFFWVVLCIFFFSSSVLSKLKAKEKFNTTSDFAKGSTKRDAVQVIANGLIPLLFALGYAVSELLPNLITSNTTLTNPFNPFFIGVFVAFAVHTADTWATEIGILAKNPPRLVTNLRRKVDPGTSGGITINGCLASLFGGVLIALVYSIALVFTSPTIAINGKGIIIFFLISIGGFFGSILDSIEGATIQGIYYCDHCKKETETNPHKRCGNETTLYRGDKRINNDFVNMSSALFITSCISLIVSII